MKKKFACILLLTLGQLYAQNKKIDSLLALLPEANAQQKTTALIELTNYWNLPKLSSDSAFAFLQEAAQNMKVHVNNKLQADLYYNFGNYYDRKMIKDSALGYFLKSFALYERIKEQIGLGSACSRIGTLYWDLKNYDLAKKYFEQSLSINKVSKNSFGIANSMVNIASVYYSEGNFPKALEYYKSALILFKQLNNKKNIVITLNNIGSVYLDTENYPEALLSYHEGLSMAELRHDSAGISLCLGGIADVYLALKDYRNSIKTAERSLEIAKRQDDLEQVNFSYKALLSSYQELNDYKMALHYANLIIEIKDSLYNRQTSENIARMQTQFDTEKKEKQNQLLFEQNKVKDLQLSRNRYFIFGISLVFILVTLIGLLFFRQNKLRSEQKAIQLEQKLLRSQMNPHFIFNSLQAIQNFILKNDTKEAVKYLSSFASVTRAVLENSIHETISLQKEITLLEQYLQLQKLRYNNLFDYTITLIPQVDPEAIDIPPMLAQPFIENAIEHGMSKIKGGGLISISYSKDYNNLYFEISDNGSGISGETSNKGHHSRAMSITKERIALLNKNKTTKTSFTISEAYPDDVNKGVKVSFSIPF